MTIFDDDFAAFGGNVSTSGLPTFDSQGNLLGNLTSSQGQVPSENSLTSPAFGLQGVTLPGIGGPAAGTAPAAASAGVSGAGTPPAATTGSVAGSPANNWFVRGVVVILGFIFVAVGLSQFGVVQKLRQ